MRHRAVTLSLEISIRCIWCVSIDSLFDVIACKQLTECSKHLERSIPTSACRSMSNDDALFRTAMHLADKADVLCAALSGPRTVMPRLRLIPRATRLKSGEWRLRRENAQLSDTVGRSIARNADKRHCFTKRWTESRIGNLLYCLLPMDLKARTLENASLDVCPRIDWKHCWTDIVLTVFWRVVAYDKTLPGKQLLIGIDHRSINIDRFILFTFYLLSIGTCISVFGFIFAREAHVSDSRYDIVIDILIDWYSDESNQDVDYFCREFMNVKCLNMCVKYMLLGLFLQGKLKSGIRFTLRFIAIEILIDFWSLQSRYMPIFLYIVYICRSHFTYPGKSSICLCISPIGQMSAKRLLRIISRHNSNIGISAQMINLV
jgi:hypothetical protein